MAILIRFRDIVGGDSQGDDYKFSYTLPSQSQLEVDSIKVGNILNSLVVMLKCTHYRLKNKIKNWIKLIEIEIKK